MQVHVTRIIVLSKSVLVYIGQYIPRSFEGRDLAGCLRRFLARWCRWHCVRIESQFPRQITGDASHCLRICVRPKIFSLFRRYGMLWVYVTLTEERWKPFWPLPAGTTRSFEKNFNGIGSVVALECRRLLPQAKGTIEHMLGNERLSTELDMLRGVKNLINELDTQVILCESISCVCKHLPHRYKVFAVC